MPASRRPPGDEGDLDRRARIAVLALGIGAILAGATLTLRPFASLDALTILISISLALAGLAELAGSARARDPRIARITGIGLALTGILAVALPGLSIAAVATLTGIGLIVTGGGRLAAGLRGTTDERYAAIVSGLAGVVCGVLALTWPDVTVLVVALLVGPVAILVGAAQLVRALRGHDSEPRPEGERRPLPLRLGRALRVTGALVLVAVLVPVSAWIHERSPRVDAFYATPASLPSQPGRLLRQEPFERAIPAGATARRILFTTAGDDGRIEAGSGLVVLPRREPAGPLKVVLWTHGTTGVARGCAPSLLRDPFAAGGMPALAKVVQRGWAVVAPDNPGLGTAGEHPYLIGEPAARAALDAVRAARRLPDVRLARETVVWGHSQGGGVALWTGIEQPRYAPDVPLAGVAALAPASDLPALAGSLAADPAGSIFATFVVRAYSQRYPDVRVRDYIRPTARTTYRALIGRCFAEPATLLSIASTISGDPLFLRPLDSGGLRTRLEENVPRAVTQTPTLVGQGLADATIAPPVQSAYVRAQCRAGQPIDYRTYPGRDHVGVVAADSPLIPDLMRWTGQRFRGLPDGDLC